MNMGRTNKGDFMMNSQTSSVVSGRRQIVLLPTEAALLWSRTSLLREFWDIVQTVGAWPGAAITEDRGGLRLAVNGVELGRLNWAGQLVVAVGAEARRVIVA